MKPELEKQEDGRSRWNPVYGKEYWLGYHHDRVACGGATREESVYARYFGHLDEQHVFFREVDGRILKYTAPIDAPAVWYSDGEDEPATPAFRAVYEDEITDGLIKAYIIGCLKNTIGGKKLN